MGEKVELWPGKSVEINLGNTGMQTAAKFAQHTRDVGIPQLKKDMTDVAKGAAVAPFTAAPDLVGLAQRGIDATARGGMNYLANQTGEERFRLPEDFSYSGGNYMSGNDIRGLVGLESESGAGMVGEMADPTNLLAKAPVWAAKLGAKFGPEVISAVTPWLMKLGKGENVAEQTVKMGDDILVFRVGSGSDTLAGRNAGDAEGTANFMAYADDSMSSVGGAGDTLSVWRMPQQEWGKYEGFKGGNGSNALAPGRTTPIGGRGEQYSFGKTPEGAEKVAEVPLSEIRATMRSENPSFYKGSEFDDAGSIAGGEYLEDAGRNAMYTRGETNDVGLEFFHRNQSDLSPQDRQFETEFAQWIRDNPEDMARQFSALPSTHNGRILSVDDFRELFPAYRGKRSLSEATHEPSSAGVKQLWRARLDDPNPKIHPTNGKPRVLFVGGGTGAGKTSAMKGADDYHQVLDSNLGSFNSAKGKIDDVLNLKKHPQGYEVDITFTWRDSLEAFEGMPPGSLDANGVEMKTGSGALSRAMRPDPALGGVPNGRTIPIEAHASTHADSQETLLKLRDHYKDDDRVTITIVDNSRGASKQPNGKFRSNNRLSMVDGQTDYSVMQPVDIETLEPQLLDAAKRALDEKRITQEVYEATLGSKYAHLLK
jgi:hypothetical protein